MRDHSGTVLVSHDGRGRDAAAMERVSTRHEVVWDSRSFRYGRDTGIANGSVFAEKALIGTEWQENVRISFKDGIITETTPGATSGRDEYIYPVVIPGIPNSHSHSFQDAMESTHHRRPLEDRVGVIVDQLFLKLEENTEPDGALKNREEAVRAINLVLQAYPGFPIKVEDLENTEECRDKFKQNLVSAIHARYQAGNSDKLEAFLKEVQSPDIKLDSHHPLKMLDGKDQESFWTWREEMYKKANSLSPEELTKIYENAYRKMLVAGYTSVVEFHYVHNKPDGTPYTLCTKLSEAAIEAAKRVGMPITLLPVFYAHSGFGGQEPTERQKQFVTKPREYLSMVGYLRGRYENDPTVTIGIAFHSLRAVTHKEMRKILNDPMVKNGNFPIHIHIAEQPKEVEDCKKETGKRPVEWLTKRIFQKKLSDPTRWTLVHATHMTTKEAEALGRTGATVCLCPTTEADLGDGVLKRLRAFVRAGGKLSVGSDSNAAINPLHEMKNVELFQRLVTGERNVMAQKHSSTGREVFLRCLEGGTLSMGQKIGTLEKGKRADLLVLDHETLRGQNGDAILETLIFKEDTTYPVQCVMVDGQWAAWNKGHVPMLTKAEILERRAEIQERRAKMLEQQLWREQNENRELKVLLKQSETEKFSVIHMMGGMCQIATSRPSFAVATANLHYSREALDIQILPTQEAQRLSPPHLQPVPHSQSLPPSPQKYLPSASAPVPMALPFVPPAVKRERGRFNHSFDGSDSHSSSLPEYFPIHFPVTPPRQHDSPSSPGGGSPPSSDSEKEGVARSRGATPRDSAPMQLKIPDYRQDKPAPNTEGSPEHYYQEPPAKDYAQSSYRERIATTSGNRGSWGSHVIEQSRRSPEVSKQGVR